MKELIPFIEHNGEKAVSARALYEYLESKQDFSDWIKGRIKKYGFVENEDYEVYHNFMENPNGGRPLIEYALSIDCAKELSMVEGNAKGRTARRYFIACEAKAKELSSPDNFLKQMLNDPDMAIGLLTSLKEEREANALQSERLALQDNELKQAAPKVDLVNRSFDSGHLTDIGQTAKILKLPYGRNTFFSELRNKGIFFKNRNEPKQEYIERGYFDVRVKSVPRDNHPSFMVTKVLVTSKGLYWLSKLFWSNTQGGMPALNLQ